MQKAGVRLAIGTGQGGRQSVGVTGDCWVGTLLRTVGIRLRTGCRQTGDYREDTQTLGGLAANEVAYVGDAVYDVGASREAGVVRLERSLGC